MRILQSFWGGAPDPDRGAYSVPPYPLARREGVTPPPAPSLFIHLPDQCSVPSDAHVLRNTGTVVELN